VPWPPVADNRELERPDPRLRAHKGHVQVMITVVDECPVACLGEVDMVGNDGIYRFGLPPEFPLASTYPSIVRYLSGRNRYAITRSLLA